MPEHNPELSPGQLLDVWLESVRYRRDADFVFDESQSLSYSVDFDTVPTQVDPGDSMVELCARIRWGSDGESAGPFELEVKVTAAFSWDEPEVDRDYLEGWLKFNGTYLLWPYLRNYIATITTMGGVPSLHLQTVQVPTWTSEADVRQAIPPDAAAG